MADFKDLDDRAWTIRRLYVDLETQRYGRPWSREEVALGFIGDVGDLAKLVQAAEGFAPSPTRKRSSPTNWPTACGA